MLDKFKVEIDQRQIKNYYLTNYLFIYVNLSQKSILRYINHIKIYKPLFNQLSKSHPSDINLLRGVKQAS